ncbi:arabinose-5-phosphate isomerase [Candidatus Hakubella thermalkaliphila]|uniref:Arabinose-5-phosphate isomerase n=1 Tax=Candidatus Hakubella thermalkaliphila TaxID=2754717 RepID=A0A6V8PSI4_9ACTN|nr:SIS domain-containing protein [Candidatus Hakubella thermalkaliphila]GFP25621.1 arabinose-5-phosphate isomerase [Candidatus Hakubella thermalkaliphila]GFP27986.1 arabinose-5-phosphate isomerase [Candidatus Hakubella thermalkaliphila]GFP35585.1 arabinose-5-phosphate isomerase [Candidatus Hakubella thermalkaliphila]GFP42534.1 arabinose-5-phosphate isomerase [Candidatus Hakubella thermalkaliphila]
MQDREAGYDLLKVAREAIRVEADAVRGLEESIDGSFLQAIEIIKACSGRVVVTGVGKSGHVGKKIAATLASTGTPAFFVHSDEALHGDLGMITHQDVVVAVTNSGETPEILAMLATLKKVGAKIIAITGKKDSTLGKSSDLVLLAAVKREADHLNLAPTASSTAALALGDALAIALAVERGFSRGDFGLYHPGGALGRVLKKEVEPEEDR